MTKAQELLRLSGEEGHFKYVSRKGLSGWWWYRPGKPTKLFDTYDQARVHLETRQVLKGQANDQKASEVVRPCR